MGIETAIIAAGVGSAVAGAVGSIASGKQQEAAYKYNASINERNAQVAEMQGEQLVYANELEIERFKDDFQDLQAATTQAFRYNGFAAGSGTPLKIALANAAEADEEIAIRRYNAKVGKQQTEESATQERMQAQLNRLYGRQARTAGYINAGTSLLKAGAQMAMAGGVGGGGGGGAPVGQNITWNSPRP